MEPQLSRRHSACDRPIRIIRSEHAIGRRLSSDSFRPWVDSRVFPQPARRGTLNQRFHIGLDLATVPLLGSRRSPPVRQSTPHLVSTSLLRSGECYNEAPETDRSSFELVDCSGEWEYRVLNSFDVAEADRYPGEDFFEQRASESCDRQYSYFLFPSAKSWGLGDRTVKCVQEN